MRREDTVVTTMPSFGGSRPASAFDTGETSVRGHTPPPRPVVPPPPTPALKVVSYAPARHEVTLDQPMPMPAPSAPQPVARGNGKVIVLFGCRGGAGATTIAVNVGAALVRAGKSVCVLDLDLQLGDVNVALDLEPNTSIAALAREAGTIDAAALRRRLQRHDSGVFCLSQTGRLDDVDPQMAERMPALLAMLCDHFDVVLVDGVRDFGDHALAALDMADQIALVLTQDVPAVRRAARVTQLFRKLGYSERKISIVLNRHSAKSSVPETEIARVLGMPIAAQIRNDYTRMRKAMDEGALLETVARGSAVARDVEQLAGRLAGDAPVAAASRGFLAKIFGGK